MYTTLTPTRTIPVELAQARATANTAWRLYDEILDSGNRDAIASALIKASDCDNAAHKWFVRWQALGGTSDIDSIVDAEAASHPAPEDVDGSGKIRLPKASKYIVSQDWLDRHTNNGADDLKPLTDNVEVK